MSRNCIRFQFYLGTDLQNKKTPKQEFHQEYSSFLVEQFMWKSGEKKLHFLSIGRNKIVHPENKKVLDEILVLLFNCFVNPFSEVDLTI